MQKQRWLIAKAEDLIKELIKGKEGTVTFSELLDELKAIADDGGAKVIWILDWGRFYDESQWEVFLKRVIPWIERMGLKVKKF